MNTFKFLSRAFMASMMALAFTACSDDDTPQPDGGGGQAPGTETRQHFDIFMSIGGHGGMTRGDGIIVRSVADLTAATPMIDIRGEGVEFRDDNNSYALESIQRGEYYYQVPESGDRFTKLRITDEAVQVVQEQPFVQNTYSCRRYTHAWLDDNTLVIMAANGDYDRILWTKLNATDMSILAEGTLDLPVPYAELGYKAFSTSGILTYREADRRLFYFYFGKTSSGRTGESGQYFYTAVINPETMTVESTAPNGIEREMAGSSYGELMQSSVMYDEAGNLFLATFTEQPDGTEKGQLLRINRGETNFDPAYRGFPDADGKLLTVQYLGNGKALAYARNDAAGTSIDSYSHYYTVIDLASGTRQRLACDGQEIDYSGGRFSQRTAVAGGKAYIGVNTADANPCIYIYDTASGTVEKGAEIAEGYYFDMLRVVED